MANQTTAKTNLIFLPLILLSIFFVITYAFLYWLFYIQLNLIPLKVDIVQYWIPAGLSFISILLFIRPRVHLLKLDKDNGRIRGLYYIVGSAVFCVPAVITLTYLDSATGKLTILNSIEEISQKPATKYYSLNSYVLNKDKIGIESGITYSGKNNQYLNFDIYVVIPFTAGLADTLRSPHAFLSVKYHKHVSSNISDFERKYDWERFWEKSFKSFDEESIHFRYLERIANTEDRDNFVVAAENSGLYKRKSAIVILKYIDEPFEERNGNKLGYIFLSFGIGAFIWFIMIVIPGLHEQKAISFTSTNKSYLIRELTAAYSILKPRHGFIATPALIALNVLIFIIMVLKGFGFVQFLTRDLIPMGALYEPGIQKGEWWRLITGMFLHDGILHLLMNMVSLYLAGIFLESYLGTKRFFFAYLLSGIAAGLISLWWHDKPVVAVGASGAIFGLYGILLSMIVFNRFDISLKKFMLVLLACTAGYSLLMGFLSKGVDNSAHLGGLAAGFIFGSLFTKRVGKEYNI
ncbi:MAG TPA: rhomboid family intramembrane serine protease [Chitinophagaceae bacterium]